LGKTEREGKKTDEGEHLLDSVSIVGHSVEERKHLDDALDVRDEFVGEKRDLLFLLVRDLHELDVCCEKWMIVS
jgi:hypothetical protein